MGAVACVVVSTLVRRGRRDSTSDGVVSIGKK